MSGPRWKRAVNGALARATGYRLERAARDGRATRRRPDPSTARPGDRLLVAPAFILCTVRSGSTLLRVLLDSHSEVHAPHELHLRHIETRVTADYAERALAEAGLDARALRFLLWDRLLHRELAAARKRRLVNKTPNDVFIADEITECWPDARFIFLLRHPLAATRSRQAARPQDSDERNLEMILRYGEALEHARRTHPGLTVRYEELTADPERVLRAVCDFLGLPWEPAMLDYGSFDHGRYRPGLGDWKEKIRSGQIQPAEPLPHPDEVPAALRDLCAAWGYLPAPDPARGR